MKCFILCAILLAANAAPFEDEFEKRSSPPIQKCFAGKADVLFVLDSSGSIHRYFSTVKEFVRGIVKQFTIGPNNVQVGGITFGTSVKTSFRLGSKPDATSTDAAIRAIANLNLGGTYTHYALKRAQDELVSRGRKDAAKFVVVITDGISASYAGTKIAAANLKKQAMTTVYAIGVGTSMTRPGTADRELHNIASNNGTVEKLSDIRNLARHVNSVATHMCDAIVDEKIIPACGALRLDMAFIIDKSGSITKKHFEDDIKPFCRSIIRRFWVSKEGTQFAAISYGNTAQVELNFTTTMSKRKILKDITGIQYPTKSQWTYTNYGLDKARQLFSGPGVRPYALSRQVYMVITDGKSTKSASTQIAAKAARDAGGIVVAIGIGNANEAELKAMAGSNGAYFVHKSMTNLGSIINKVSNLVCGSVCKP